MNAHVEKMMPIMWDVLSKFPVELEKVDSITVKCIVSDTTTLFHLLKVFQHSGRRWIVQLDGKGFCKFIFTAYIDPRDKLSNEDTFVEIQYKTCLLKSCI